MNVDNDRSSSRDCLEELVEHQHQLFVCHRTLENCKSHPGQYCLSGTEYSTVLHWLCPQKLIEPFLDESLTN